MNFLMLHISVHNFLLLLFLTYWAFYCITSMLNVKPLESIIHRIHKLFLWTFLFSGLNLSFFVKLFLHKVGGKDIILNLTNNYKGLIFQGLHTFACKSLCQLIHDLNSSPIQVYVCFNLIYIENLVLATLKASWLIDFNILLFPWSYDRLLIRLL